MNVINETECINGGEKKKINNNNNVLAYYASKNLDAFTKILYTYIQNALLSLC